MEKVKHPFRLAIGDLLENAITSMRDRSVELVGKQFSDSNIRIPLYYVDESSRRVSYFDVDFLILKDDKIRVVFEIGEDRLNPTRSWGSYLTSSFSQFHIHKMEEGNRRIDMGNNTIFIQIINTTGLKENVINWTSQIESIENSVKAKFVKGSNITDYRLFHGTSIDFLYDKVGLIPVVMKALDN